MKQEIIADELFIRVADKTFPAAQALTESRRLVLEREKVVSGLETSLDDAKAKHRRALLAGEDADRQHVDEFAQRLDAARDALTDALRQVAEIEQAIDQHRANQMTRQASAELTKLLQPYDTRRFA